MTNPGAREQRGSRTRRRVETSLLALLAERGYERTSVRALVARAEVGRSTFYEHYRDKDAVLASALAGLGRELTAAGSKGGVFAFLEPLLAHVKAHRALAARLRRSAPGAVVLARFRALVQGRIAAELARRFPLAPDARVILASEHVAGGLLALIETHLREGDALDAAALGAAWRALVWPGVDAWLGEDAGAS